MRQAAAVFVNSSAAAPNSDFQIDADSDTEDNSQSRDITPPKIPKVCLYVKYCRCSLCFI